MTKILIIKTSSMGDIIHTLPALNDAAKFIPGVSFDWVIEEAFVEIPKWHPLVENVIPVAWRRFRKEPLRMLNRGELGQFLKTLRKRRYDFVIDAQGLMKSAIIARFSRGLRCGLDRHSAREPIASFAYQKRVTVKREQHAITRMRQLFSQVLDYSLKNSPLDYGLKLQENVASSTNKKYLLFIHGTTWATKEWPESYWQELTKIATSNGYEVLLPWGNNTERERATRIAEISDKASILPRTSLTELAYILLSAKGAVSVDTGLGHLAAALKVPTISLYGPTDPKIIGTIGDEQKQIVVNFSCSPCWNQKCGYGQPSEIIPACFASIPPKLVWEQLTKVMRE